MPAAYRQIEPSRGRKSGIRYLLCWSLKNEAAFEAELHDKKRIVTISPLSDHELWYDGATSGEIKSGSKGRAVLMILGVQSQWTRCTIQEGWIQRASSLTRKPVIEPQRQ